MIKLPELLAPAGTLDAFKTAILYGADAVYAGLPGFSMRARAKITTDEVRAGIALAHSAGRKVYLAFNLFAHERDFENMSRVSDTINYLRPDALIVSDPGVMMWVREHHPDMPIHVSTQANICSAAAVKFWQNAGARLCVLAREVSHSEFKIIREKCPDMGLEIFVHGAMCMSYSGRCLLSNFITGRPANRGACAQLCRWKYDVILREHETGIEMPIDQDDRGTYIMNARDLCLMSVLRDVIESRPDSLKIEGRNRSEYYVGAVVHAYRAALDAYLTLRHLWRNWNAWKRADTPRHFSMARPAQTPRIMKRRVQRQITMRPGLLRLWTRKKSHWNCATKYVGAPKSNSSFRTVRMIYQCHCHKLLMRKMVIHCPKCRRASITV